MIRLLTAASAALIATQALGVSVATAAPTVEATAVSPPELVEFVAAEQKVSQTAATVRLERLAAVAAAVERLRNKPPQWFAGAWVDPKTLKQIVGVVGDAGKIPAALELAPYIANGQTEIVERKYPQTTLASVRKRLLSRARQLKNRAPKLIATVDEESEVLRLRVSSKVSKAVIDRLSSAAAGSGLNVVVEPLPPNQSVVPKACSFPNCDRPLRSGTGIGASGGSNCSGGFFARSSKYRYFVTAGHCRISTSKGTTWYAKSPTYYNHDTGNRSWSIGKNLVNMTEYGPYDFMAVRISSDSFWYANDPGGYYEDRRTGDNLGSYYSTRLPQPGEPSCRYGISSNYACGYVLNNNLTTYVGSVPVSGLFSTGSCATPGDSGGPYLGAGGVLLGVLSGGAGNCASEPGAPSSGYTVASQATTVLQLTSLKLLAGS